MDTQVLVVGAGPTGLLLAAELKRRGLDCMVIDSLEGPRHWDRATIVHPRSVEFLASMGLAERFLSSGVRQRTVRLYSDGELLGEMDLSTCGSPYGFNLNLSEELTESILDEFPSGASPSRLHELTYNSLGHTVLLLARRTGERLEHALGQLCELTADPALFGSVTALCADPGSRPPIGLLDPSVADQLGVEDVTVLAVRPDGHVGFRSDGLEAAPVRDYIAPIRSGGQ